MRRPLIVLFFVVAYSTLYSQNQSLRLARSVYEQGRLQEIPSILTPDVIGKLTVEEKVEAYKLLCLTNIYLEEPDQADDYMLKILQTNHEFVLNRDSDPAEFVALYETFRYEPVYRVGAKFGANATQPNVTEAITAVNIADGSAYKFLIGIQFGISGDLPLNKRFTLHGDLQFIQKRFQLDLISERGIDPFTGKLLTNTFTGIENQNWVSLPISLEYRLGNSKYKPYIGGGGSLDYLLSDNLTNTRLRNNTSPIDEKSYDLKAYRKALNLSAIVAAGIKIKVKKGYIVSELRFIYGITTVNSSDNAFAEPELALGPGYADPTYKLASLAISGSYILDIYKPKKLTK